MQLLEFALVGGLSAVCGAWLHGSIVRRAPVEGGWPTYPFAEERSLTQVVQSTRDTCLGSGIDAVHDTGSHSKCYTEGRTGSKTFDEQLLLFDREEHSFAMVSDMDRGSRDPQRFVWKSFMKRGSLVHTASGRYRIKWGDTLHLQSNTAKHNRSMELSELVLFGHRLLAMCDYTGLIFKIDTYDIAAGKLKPKVLQRWAIADGDGNSVKPCKMEWSTVKDGALWVGSVGKEWTSADGSTIEHRDPEWVKIIDQSGRVQNINWGPVYGALRKATNTSITTGGWLWHEAVHWDPRTRRWFFLPRKESRNVSYIPGQNEARCSNLLIVASEDFAEVNASRIGPLEPMRGFTALRKVPGTADVFMALKVKEAEGEMKTWITVFNLRGEFLLEPDPFEHVADVKYEGLEFFHV